ncbi:unnamed protein product [Trichobilharzia szidati]|nr:unnamed protein product [Trichobilharzia szidati]
MGKTITEEPLFQKKRKFKFPDGFNLNKQFSNPKEDDYFVIGPSDGKFTHPIAYRNSQKRNARSVSPKRKENSDKTLKKSTQTTANQHDYRPQTVHRTRIDEAIQTDGTHKALEAEIRRIRNEIDNRKRLLREKEEIKHNRKQVKTTENEPLQLNRKVDTQCSKPVGVNQHSVNICVPDAPRQDRSIKTPLQEYGQEKNQKLAIPKVTKYAIENARISEYQSAFKAPQMNYRLDSTKFIRPSTSASCKPDKFQGRKIPYDTEYRHEYKPFKYVPIDQLKSTGIIRDEKNVNIIPLRRPVSAYGFREIKDTDGDANKRRIRALTPPSKIPKKANHNNISEYNAKYLNYADLLSSTQPNRSASTTENNSNLPYNWYRELVGLREKADQYRKRDRESHFSREHLAQLESDSVSYWDPPSEESYMQNIEKYKESLQMPRAGKPSTDLVSDPYNEPLASQRRRAMLDSYNVAQIMDQEDCSDTEDEQNPQYHHHCQPAYTHPCSEYRHYDVNCPRDNNYVGMLPGNTKYTQENELQHYNSDCSLKSENDPPRTSLEGDCRACNPCSNNKWADYQDYHHHHQVGERTRNSCPRKQRSLDETESLTSCSSLSEKSMELSSRLASETLERAQRQHERVLREQKLYNENVYSPTAYSNCKSVQ